MGNKGAKPQGGSSVLPTVAQVPFGSYDPKHYATPNGFSFPDHYQALDVNRHRGLGKTVDSSVYLSRGGHINSGRHVQAGNAIPLRTQRPRSLGRQRPNQEESNSNNVIGSKTNNLDSIGSSYSLNRQSCRSAMSAQVTPGTAQVFRLTDPGGDHPRRSQAKPEYPKPNADRKPRNRSNKFSSSRSLASCNGRYNLLDAIPSLRRLGELLREFSSLFLVLPEGLREALNDILDFTVLDNIPENWDRRQDISASVQTNLVTIGELIPLMNQHLIISQDLFQAIHRMEEKLRTFETIMRQLSTYNPPNNPRV
ncbi:unnamed protein product [Calicophoron daubneyi]|uniref:Uncharacterized protein n=1 Tax=Calicophoron daubneyi TaxID=300641 RepID=A0AAV2T6B6_CALDB